MTKNSLKLGLAFDDVLIVPKYSKIRSRRNIDLKTRFSRRIKINAPIVSANMDTVTESDMAIAMARQGGIGVIHRFNSIEDQTREVKRVKRAENLVISDPVTINKEATLEQTLALMKENRISGVLVVDKNKILQGIITSRDVRFCQDHNVRVGKIMTPYDKLITGDPRIKIDKAIEIFARHKIEKLPLIDKDRVLHGLITAADFIKISQHKNAAKDKKGRLIVAAAIGVKKGLERAESLVKQGVDALVIDIAHGHHKSCIDLIKLLKKKYKKIDIAAGNAATADGARDLIEAGADAVKIGIGPGAACSTRVVAGAGVPQITAILRAAKAAHEYNIPLIADGGIRTSGDLVKAIAAGASTVMIGSLFAGTKESPGEYFIEDGAAFKGYRGLASRDASWDRSLLVSNQQRSDRAPEGVSTRIVYKGELSKVLASLIDGLQSGMSYSGAENISDFWNKAEFIRITKAGYKEGLPRSLSSN